MLSPKSKDKWFNKNNDSITHKIQIGACNYLKDNQIASSLPFRFPFTFPLFLSFPNGNFIT